jgi:hypothetical protein
MVKHNGERAGRKKMDKKEMKKNGAMGQAEPSIGKGPHKRCETPIQLFEVACK